MRIVRVSLALFIHVLDFINVRLTDTFQIFVVIRLFLVSLMTRALLGHLGSNMTKEQSLTSEVLGSEILIKRFSSTHSLSFVIFGKHRTFVWGLVWGGTFDCRLINWWEFLKQSHYDTSKITHIFTNFWSSKLWVVKHHYQWSIVTITWVLYFFRLSQHVILTGCGFGCAKWCP